jgi:SAM-dependent methyltransferase
MPLDMKGDWDRRAKDDPRWFIATSVGPGEESFAASGRRDVAAFFDGLEHLLRPDALVLDIGCGIGRMDEHVAPRVGHLTGLDVSGEMVTRARARLRGLRNIDFVEGDGWTLPFPDGSFDLVFSHIVFQHVPRRVAQSCFGEAFRVLRPGGDFVFQMPEAVPGAPADPPDQDTFEMRFWLEAELRATLEPLGFTWVACRRFAVHSEKLDFNQLRVHARRPPGPTARHAR